MVSKWDRIEQAAQRAFADFDFPEVRVYNYSETYDSDTGGSTWTESEASVSPVPMEISESDEGDMNVNAGGQSSEEEAQFWASIDDVGVGYGYTWGSTWGASIITDAGQPGSKPTELEVVASNQRYVVTNTTVQSDGTLRISATEK